MLKFKRLKQNVVKAITTKFHVSQAQLTYDITKQMLAASWEEPEACQHAIVLRDHNII